MNKYFLRPIVFFLVPCLMADPAAASGLVHSFASTSTSVYAQNTYSNLFQEQAFILALEYVRPWHTKSAAKIYVSAGTLLAVVPTIAHYGLRPILALMTLGFYALTFTWISPTKAHFEIFDEERRIGQDIIERENIGTIIQNNNAAGRPTVIIPFTGGTPLRTGFYIAFVAELVRLHRAGVDLSHLHFFMRDEYWVGPDFKKKYAAGWRNHPQSYVHYMMQYLMIPLISAKIGISMQNFHPMDGESEKPREEAARFEADIERLTEGHGADIAFGGIGSTGHISFNESIPILDDIFWKQPDAQKNATLGRFNEFLLQANIGQEHDVLDQLIRRHMHYRSGRPFIEQLRLEIAAKDTARPNKPGLDNLAHRLIHQDLTIYFDQQDARYHAIEHMIASWNASLPFNVILLPESQARNSKTRFVELALSTIIDNSENYDDLSLMPDKAITIGVGTNLKARRIVQVATGPKTAKVLRKVAYEGVSMDNTVSAVISGNHVLYVDRAAAPSINPIEPQAALPKAGSPQGPEEELLEIAKTINHDLDGLPVVRGITLQTPEGPQILWIGQPDPEGRLRFKWGNTRFKINPLTGQCDTAALPIILESKPVIDGLLLSTPFRDIKIPIQEPILRMQEGVLIKLSTIRSQKNQFFLDLIFEGQRITRANPNDKHDKYAAGVRGEFRYIWRKKQSTFVMKEDYLNYLMLPNGTPTDLRGLGITLPLINQLKAHSLFINVESIENRETVEILEDMLVRLFRKLFLLDADSEGISTADKLTRLDTLAMRVGKRFEIRVAIDRALRDSPYGRLLINSGYEPSLDWEDVYADEAANVINLLAQLPDSNQGSTLTSEERAGYQRLAEQAAQKINEFLPRGGLAIVDGLAGLGKSTLGKAIVRNASLIKRRLVPLKLDGFLISRAELKQFQASVVAANVKITDKYSKIYKIEELERFMISVLMFLDSPGDPNEVQEFIIPGELEPLRLQRGDVMLIDGETAHYVHAIAQTRTPKITFRMTGDPERGREQIMNRVRQRFAGDEAFIEGRGKFFDLAILPSALQYDRDTFSAVNFRVLVPENPKQWTLRAVSAPAPSTVSLEEAFEQFIAQIRTLDAQNLHPELLEIEFVRSYHQWMYSVDAWLENQIEGAFSYIYPFRGVDLVPLTFRPTFSLNLHPEDFERGVNLLLRAFGSINEFSTDIRTAELSSGPLDASNLDNYRIARQKVSGAWVWVMKGYSVFAPTLGREIFLKSIFTEVLREGDYLLILMRNDFFFQRLAEESGFFVVTRAETNWYLGHHTHPQSEMKQFLIPNAVLIMKKQAGGHPSPFNHEVLRAA